MMLAIAVTVLYYAFRWKLTCRIDVGLPQHIVLGLSVSNLVPRERVEGRVHRKKTRQNVCAM